MPLSLATAEYVAEREPTWSAGWRDAVDGFFANRVLPHFGESRTVSTILRADVERFRSGEVGRLKVNGEPVSGATVNRMMAALSAFGEWCLTEGRQYHMTNPWADHEALPEDEMPVPALEEEQVDRVLAALEQPGTLPSHGRRRYKIPWRLVVEFARETGLRRGELGRVARADIRGNTLFVVSTRRRGRTKGRRMRPLPLSARALAVAEAMPAREDGLLFGPLPDPRKAFRTAAKAVGLERLWLHLFRHLFASRISERGAGRHELTAAGGWASSRMADRYTHARMERLRELVEGPAGADSEQTEKTGGQDDA